MSPAAAYGHSVLAVAYGAPMMNWGRLPQRHGRQSRVRLMAILLSTMGQVRALLDNFDGDALGMWRTAGRVRSV